MPKLVLHRINEVPMEALLTDSLGGHCYLWLGFELEFDWLMGFLDVHIDRIESTLS